MDAAPSGAGYTHANRLRWAQHSAAEVDGEKRIDLALPLQEGVRPFALAMLDREGADLSCEPGRNPANDIDRLCARLMALGLNDYARMDLDWPGIEEARFPAIFLGAGELPEIRRTLEEWDWFRETFFAHVEDEFFNSLAAEDMLLSKGLPPIGRDLAGAYLATGDESYAARAKEELVPRFSGLVEHMLGYSIGNELNFGMSLGQWIPRDALALDFILGSGQFTPEERLSLLRKMLFLAETVISEDTWPRYESGLALSMRNFNTHVIFGRAVLAGREPRDIPGRNSGSPPSAIRSTGCWRTKSTTPGPGTKRSPTRSSISAISCSAPWSWAPTRPGHFSRSPGFERSWSTGSIP